MVRWEVALVFIEFVVALVAEWKIGLMAALLVALVFAGIRLPHRPTAVGAAVLFAILMSQA
ncbi:hypothetical protein [Streptomyces phaeochromogenes]|uniref:hypothetical protein n=1 Tax=Streptomyces phaeochromogenes TaxID=1923 RepID=UPI002DDA5AAB|nr:hypothetical protein [Streptomyces phaeochromogenes]WRZ30542.1 hypothetical protein OG931_23730 [Streptomyces phaeochromogenes]